MAKKSKKSKNIKMPKNLTPAPQWPEPVCMIPACGCSGYAHA